MPLPGIEAKALSARLSQARVLGALAWLVGLCLMAGLIASRNLEEITAAIALAGWRLGLVALAHFGTLLADTLGWRALLRKAHRPGLGPMFAKRWIGSSINSLLPVAHVGGVFVRAQLLARGGVSGPVAGASVVVDVTAGLVTQVLFILLGIVLFLERHGGAGWLVHLSSGVALLGALLVGFWMAQRRGLFLPLARVLERAARGRAWDGLVGNAATLDREIIARYEDQPRLARCAGWRSLGWLWGNVEIWLAFWLLGHPIGIAEAVILESLGQALRSAGFALPGGLGAQEGGIVAGGVLLGIAPDIALAVALVKRARELVYGVPGLIAWSLIGLPRPRA
jgi:putative membrane protein